MMMPGTPMEGAADLGFALLEPFVFVLCGSHDRGAGAVILAGATAPGDGSERMMIPGTPPAGGAAAGLVLLELSSFVAPFELWFGALVAGGTSRRGVAGLGRIKGEALLAGACGVLALLEPSIFGPFGVSCRGSGSGSRGGGSLISGMGGWPSNTRGRVGAS
jgi:hypothetical protein